MADFPSYATLLLQGFNEVRESALMRTEMESGPPKQAKIKSRVLTTRNAQVYLKTKADYLSFRSWYSSINEGADWFSWRDPVTGTTVQARFAGGGFDASPMAGLRDAWVVKAKLETWG